MELKLTPTGPSPHLQNLVARYKLIFQQTLLSAQLCMDVQSEVSQGRDGSGCFLHRD